MQPNPVTSEDQVIMKSGQAPHGADIYSNTTRSIVISAFNKFNQTTVIEFIQVIGSVNIGQYFYELARNQEIDHIIFGLGWFLV